MRRFPWQLLCTQPWTSTLPEDDHSSAVESNRSADFNDSEFCTNWENISTASRLVRESDRLRGNESPSRNRRRQPVSHGTFFVAAPAATARDEKVARPGATIVRVRQPPGTPCVTTCNNRRYARRTMLDNSSCSRFWRMYNGSISHHPQFMHHRGVGPALPAAEEFLGVQSRVEAGWRTRAAIDSASTRGEPASR